MTENTAPVCDDSSPPRRRAKSSTPKKARRITPEYLHNAALYYLQRYAASSGRVRQVLTDKIKRSCHDHPDQNLTDLLNLVDGEITTLTRVQLLDDERLADLFLSNYRNRGLSARLIRVKLQAKGFDLQLIDRMMSDCDQNLQHHHETNAAIRYLQRRKLWPYLTLSLTDRVLLAKARQKSWAALARQGYSSAVIKAACTCSDDTFKFEDD